MTYEYFHCEMRFGVSTMGRFTRALVKVSGSFTDSSVSPSYRREQDAPILFVVKLPFGKRTEFEALSGLVLSQNPRLEISVSPYWRHKKTGGIYKHLFEGCIENTLEPCVIYQSEEDGARWVRPKSEFYDGRFEQIGFPGERTRHDS